MNCPSCAVVVGCAVVIVICEQSSNQRFDHKNFLHIYVHMLPVYACEIGQWAHITKQFQEEFSLFLCTPYPETQFQEDFVNL